MIVSVFDLRDIIVVVTYVNNDESIKNIRLVFKTLYMVRHFYLTEYS